jgi:hypothetical protein
MCLRLHPWQSLSQLYLLFGADCMIWGWEAWIIQDRQNFQLFQFPSLGLQDFWTVENNYNS